MPPAIAERLSTQNPTGDGILRRGGVCYRSGGKLMEIPGAPFNMFAARFGGSIYGLRRRSIRASAVCLAFKEAQKTYRTAVTAITVVFSGAFVISELERIGKPKTSPINNAYLGLLVATALLVGGRIVLFGKRSRRSCKLA